MDFFDTLPEDRFNDSVLAGDFFDPPGVWHSKREKVPRPSGYGGYLEAAHKRAARWALFNSLRWERFRSRRALSSGG
jgi:hypothetical protein